MYPIHRLAISISETRMRLSERSRPRRGAVIGRTHFSAQLAEVGGARGEGLSCLALALLSHRG